MVAISPPFLRGEEGAASPHEAFYYYTETHLDAVRSGRWKLVFPRPGLLESEWLLFKNGAFLAGLAFLPMGPSY